MASLVDVTKPYLAYYSVPMAWAFTHAAVMYKFIASGKHHDPAYPRTTVANCQKDTSMDKKTVLRIQRAEAAAANGLETLGLYAGGIAAAVAAGVPTETVNYLSVGYLGSRAVFNIVYILLQDNRKFAPLRSLSWCVGIGITITLWIKAGNKAAA